MQVRIEEFLEAQKRLEEIIKKGSDEINFRSFQELYDNHLKLLEAYRLLEKAFLNFHFVHKNPNVFLVLDENEIQIGLFQDDEH